MERHDIEQLGQALLFDNSIVQHGYAPYLRDYDVIVDVYAASPNQNYTSYVEGRYRYRFTHCVFAQISTSLSDHVWIESWSDKFIDFKTWEEKGSPPGYVWGVLSAEAYPGLSYVENSELAIERTNRLGRTMHEIAIETNCYRLQLVFHNLQLTKIGQGDPETRKIVSVEIPLSIDDFYNMP